MAVSRRIGAADDGTAPAVGSYRWACDAGGRSADFAAKCALVLHLAVALGKPMKISPWSTLVCLLFLPIAAVAQEQGTADERQACEPDVNRLCSQFIPDRDKIILCLNQKVRELDPSCRGVILFYAQQQICAGDSSRLCGEAGQDREKVLACLSKKIQAVSASCRRALTVYQRERK
jgi:hypothetical protein